MSDNFIDRYQASGIRLPKYVCKECEGMGFIPTMDGTLSCFVCRGTGDSRVTPKEQDEGTDYC